jgi:hypothetical protein
MRSTLLTLLLLLPVSGHARRLTMAQFLATASKDYRLRNHEELTDYFKNARTSTPYLNRIELRAESDFDRPRQRYELRVYPKGWGETRHTRELTEVTDQSNRLADRAIFNSALQERYDLLLDHLELTGLLDLQRQLLAVYNDRITVLRRKSASVPDFDVTALLSAENQLVDKRLAIIRLQNRLTSIRHRMALIAGHPAEIAVPRDDLLPIAEIARLARRARRVRPTRDIDNIYLQRRRVRVKRADVRYRLEVARDRDYLRFFKVEFETDRHDQLERAFTVGLALKLPFINPDRHEANRRKVRYLEQKLRLEQERRETSERVISHSRALLRLLAQQKVLRDRKDRGDAEASFRRYLAMDGIDPLLLLKVKESILEGDIRLTEIENAIRKRHVALLDVLGRLGQRPLRNVISRRGEVLP